MSLHGSLCIGLGIYIFGYQGAVVAGSVGIFSLYASFALQTCMAISRMIVFRRTSQVAFSRKSCIYSSLACIVYGVLFALITLHPCCSAGVVLSQGRHGYLGYNKKLIGMITIGNDLITFPTMTVCYILALLGMKELRSAAQSETASLTWEQVKHEVKVLAQFLMISSVWAVHVVFFRLLQFKIIKLDLYYILTISEVNRYIFWSIDPIVCFIFLEEVRNIVFCKVPPVAKPKNEMKKVVIRDAKKENNVDLVVEEL